jgi:molecular chaperone Hsp33
MTKGGDWMRRFHLENAGVRGVIARVDGAWREIAAHAPYPRPVAELLGECLAASALFAGNVKMAGSISVQLKTGGPVSLAFAEWSSPGKLRGLARWEGDVREPLTPPALGRDALLAITMEPNEGPRYQGLVPLEGLRLSDAFEAYFRQSEQLPTLLRLAVDGTHCSGMLVQQIPGSGGTRPREAEGEFERVGVLFGTLTDGELTTLPAETILRRLFAEDEVRVQDALPLAFGCRCSRERVAAMLVTLGHPEAAAAADASGIVDVRCEFCNRTYRFDRVEIEQLFTADRSAPGPHRPQ